MTPFSITSQLSKKEYIQFVFRQTYRKWYVLIFTTFAVLNLLIFLLYILHIWNFSDETPYTQLGISCYFLVVLPLAVWYKAIRHYNSNRRIQQTIHYLFDNEYVSVKGNDFEARYSWNNVFKIKQTKNFILLYATRNTAELVKRSLLTPEQQAYILSKMSQ